MGNCFDPADREQLVAWSQELLQVLEPRANESVVQTVRQAIGDLRSDRLVLAVLGKAKRGKSTLLNAVLGRRDDAVAPIDKLPASSAISRIRWGDRERAVVVFRDGRREPIPLRRIREFVTEELNPENVKGVHVVEIEGPFPDLDRDLELVDTPGAASLHEHHDVLLHGFIPQADAIHFLVTARMPLDQDELELLQKVKEADLHKLFFVINRIDEVDSRDVSEVVAHNQKLLSDIGVPVHSLSTISAKRAFQGDAEDSGVAPLLRDIRGFLAAQKGQVLRERSTTPLISGSLQPKRDHSPRLSIC